MIQIYSTSGPVVGPFRTLVCYLISFAFASAGQAQTFEVDNDHTSLVFAVSHTGLSYTYGRFNKCAGQITISKTENAQSFAFTVEAESVDTNNQLRDEYLKGAEFFDVRAFPKIEFRSDKLTSDGDDFTAVGVLKMHGVKKDITIKMTKIGIGKGTRGKTRIGFFSKFSIKRSDFGINSLPTIIGNEIAITLSFEGILKPQATKQSSNAVESRFRQAVGLGEEFGILEP